jgi:LacI family transcriptional regulator
LRDVADRAGVNVATASRALSADRSNLVNVETARRVREAAGELGYRPNPIARGLRTQRTFTVGVLIPDLMNPLYPPLVRGVDEGLAEAGFRPVVGNTDNDPGRERSIYEALRARRVDGLVVACGRREHELIGEMLEHGMPLVVVLRAVENLEAPSVLLRDQAGAELAVRHLLDFGHRRIAHVAGPQTVSTAVARRAGFLGAIRDARLAGARVSIAERFGIEAGRDACRELLAAGEHPTAIFAGDDLIALGCMDAMAEQGLRCPEDISVVGFDDVPFANHFDPPLTTVRVPVYELGTHGARLLLEAIEGAEGPSAVDYLSTELIVRESTRPVS